MEEVGLLPHFIHIGHFEISQTLITSTLGLILFLIFLGIYNLIKAKKPESKFVNVVDMVFEGMMDFFDGLAPSIPRYAKGYIMFIFFYILWNNLVGVFGDMFVLVIPSLHAYFRPANTDVTFNLVLAVVGVVGSIVYGFQHGGVSYINKYFPLKGVGIVSKVTGPLTFVAKIFDIIIGLFIGLLEFIGEFARILSLSLRLFGNILAGMVLLGLIVSLTIQFFHVPFGLPIVFFIMELGVSFLQAFVFSLLVLVYFKLAGEGHH